MIKEDAMLKNKKIILKILTIVFVLTIYVLPNFISAEAWNMSDEITKIEEQEVDENNKAVKKTRDVMGTIISVVQVVGTGIAVIMLIVLAVKYMSSAPDAKAEIKKTMVPYVVGAIILFASSQLLAVIAEIGEGLAKSE